MKQDAKRTRRLVLLVVLIATVQVSAASAQLADGLRFRRGAVNSVVLEAGGKRLAFYRADEAVEQVLLTHHRRDVTESTRGTTAKRIAPKAEQALLQNPKRFWTEFQTKRFHDYDQQSTKIVAAPLPVDRWVSDGDQITWNGFDIDVVGTPGYTRGAVSYVMEVNGKRIAFTGDLIYGDGQLLDIYSLQDAIPEAQVRGYHGYAARLADVVASAKKIAALKPALLVPVRGPAIVNPQASLAKLIDRAERLYRNYLSTNALHWYFKKNRMEACGKRVLGEDATISLMPYSHHEEMPKWIRHFGTTRLLIAENKSAFMLDCGNARVIQQVKELIASGEVTKIDGIFVTHHHDDHTDAVAAAGAEFGCPVYCVKEYADILREPEAYHVAAMTDNPIRNVVQKRNGETLKWNEFELQFLFFPGQSLYHGALRAKRNDEKPVMFVGDAFAPSGFDDYCLQNRNLVHDDSGYFLCLQKLRQQKEPFWLVNEHIPFVFSYTDKEMDFLETQYRERREVLKELFPWDDPNYGIDEQWATAYPYGRTVKSGKSVSVGVRITNHSPQTRTFRVRFHGHNGVVAGSKEQRTILQPNEVGTVSVKVTVPDQPGVCLVTADVLSEGMEFLHWCECLLTVE